MPAALRACSVRPRRAPSGGRRHPGPCGRPAAGRSRLAGVLAPESGGSPNADDIRELYWVIFALGLIIFLLVEGLLLYSVAEVPRQEGRRRGADPRQHAARGRLDDRRGADPRRHRDRHVPQAPGHREPAELRRRGHPGSRKDGTFVAAGAKQRLPPDGKSLNILVNGQQYIWRYTYPDGDDNNLNNVFSYQEMVVPTNTTVTLEIRAQDVAHSWWIPKLGGKFDAIPGYTNYTWFKVHARRGVFTRPVRRALRPQPRQHDGAGARSLARRVRALVRGAEGGDRRRRQGGRRQAQRADRRGARKARDPSPEPSPTSRPPRPPMATTQTAARSPEHQRDPADRGARGQPRAAAAGPPG